jgi:hypothetical protein
VAGRVPDPDVKHLARNVLLGTSATEVDIPVVPTSTITIITIAIIIIIIARIVHTVRIVAGCGRDRRFEPRVVVRGNDLAEPLLVKERLHPAPALADRRRRDPQRHFHPEVSVAGERRAPGRAVLGHKPRPGLAPARGGKGQGFGVREEPQRRRDAHAAAGIKIHTSMCILIEYLNPICFF